MDLNPLVMGKWRIGRWLTHLDLSQELEMLGSRVAELESKVSELQASERDLQKREQDLLELFDLAPLAYQKIDIDGRISMVNRAQQRLLGYTADELLGEYRWNSVGEGEECKEEFLFKVSRHMAPRNGYERTGIRKDGTSFPALHHDQPFVDENGTITAYVCTTKNITLQKQPQADLILRNQEQGVLFKVAQILSGPASFEAKCG